MLEQGVSLKRMNSDAEEAIRTLALTPIRLTELSRRASPTDLAARPTPNEWSATEIVAHLRANADVWGANISRMLADSHTTIRYVSPRVVLKKPEYADRGFPETLKLFIDGRRELLDRLKALPLQDWSLGATFTGTTKSYRTVLSFAQAIASHEAIHLIQFEALFNR